MTNEQQYEVNTRGYRVPPKSDECGSGEGIIAPGQIAYLRYNQGTRGTDSWLVAGTCVRVLSFANAGFRGNGAFTFGRPALTRSGSRTTSRDLTPYEVRAGWAFRDCEIITKARG